MEIQKAILIIEMKKVCGSTQDTARGRGLWDLNRIQRAWGMDYLKNDIFDLVITDIKMPKATVSKFWKRSKNSLLQPLWSWWQLGQQNRQLKRWKWGHTIISQAFQNRWGTSCHSEGVRKEKLKRRSFSSEEKVKSSFGLENIVGKSQKMQELFTLIRKWHKAIRRSSFPVKADAGKNWSHQHCIISAIESRKTRDINCATFPEGLLESELSGMWRLLYRSFI